MPRLTHCSVRVRHERAFQSLGGPLHNKAGGFVTFRNVLLRRGKRAPAFHPPRPFWALAFFGGFLGCSAEISEGPATYEERDQANGKENSPSFTMGAPPLNGPSQADDLAARSCGTKSVQLGKGPADIVIAIDSSGSMNEEMEQVQENVNQFASKFGAEAIDYRVTLIANKGNAPTDPLAGISIGNGICVPPPLGDPDCKDKLPTFRHIDTTVGSNDALSVFLDTYAGRSGWGAQLRPDSTKVFVVVTDDDSDMPSGEFDESLLRLDPLMFGTSAKRNYVFHSITGWKENTPPLSASYCSTSENPGLEYQKLSKLTGGIIDSVCNKSYASVLDNIAKGVVAKLACELTLPHDGRADPSRVLVQGKTENGTSETLTQVTDVSKCAQFPAGWYYDNNVSPTKVLLCNGVCGRARANTSFKVDAAFGCKTEAPR